MNGHGTYSCGDTSHSGTSANILVELASKCVHMFAQSSSFLDTHNIATDVFLHVGSPPLLAGAAVVNGSHPASTTKAPSLELFGDIVSYIS